MTLTCCVTACISGLFDGRSFVPYDKISLLDSPPHRQLALEAAEQSIVLLQNKNDTLPMALAGKKVALFGAIASVRRTRTRPQHLHVASGSPGSISSHSVTSVDHLAVAGIGCVMHFCALLVC